MNAATRAALDAIAIPVDQHGLVPAMVISAGTGFSAAWAHDGGGLVP